MEKDKAFSTIKNINYHMIRITLIRALLVIFLMGITILSVVPDSNDYGIASLRLTRSGMILHIIAYFMVSLLWCLSFKMRSIKGVLLSGFIIFGYSFILELIQFYLPTRTFNPIDIAANAAGILFFVLIWIVSSHMLKRKGAGVVSPKRS